MKSNTTKMTAFLMNNAAILQTKYQNRWWLTLEVQIQYIFWLDLLNCPRKVKLVIRHFLFLQ